MLLQSKVRHFCVFPESSSVGSTFSASGWLFLLLRGGNFLFPTEGVLLWRRNSQPEAENVDRNEGEQSSSQFKVMWYILPNRRGSSSSIAENVGQNEGETSSSLQRASSSGGGTANHRQSSIILIYILCLWLAVPSPEQEEVLIGGTEEEEDAWSLSWI